MALQCCSRGDYCAPSAGCLNAIKASHPRCRFAFIEAAPPSYRASLTLQSRIRAWQHDRIKAAQRFLHNEIAPIHLEAWRLLMSTCHLENSTCDFASAVPCAVPLWVALRVWHLASIRIERSAGFGSFARASNSRDSDTLPLRAGSLIHSALRILGVSATTPLAAAASEASLAATR